MSARKTRPLLLLAALAGYAALQLKLYRTPGCDGVLFFNSILLLVTAVLLVAWWSCEVIDGRSE